jgi:hypothetical protein
VVALDDDVVTATQLWIFALGHRCDATVIETDAYAEHDFIGTIALADGVAYEATCHGATDGSGRTTVAVAHGVTQEATCYRPDHGAERRRITLLVDLLHVTHGAALVAASRGTGVHHAILVIDTSRLLITRGQRQRGNGSGNEAELTDDVVHE